MKTRELARGLVMVGVVGVMCLALAGGTASASMVFRAGYNGNTPNGGLDADVGLGGTGSTVTYGSPSIIASGQHGTSGLNADYDTLLDDVNDQLTYAGNANVPTSGTFEIWVKPKYNRGVATPPNQTYFFKANHSATNGGEWGDTYITIGHIYSNQTLLFRVNPGPSSSNSEVWYNTSAGNWAADQWTHLAMTWDASGLKAYVNGGLVGTSTVSALVVGAAMPYLHVSVGRSGESPKAVLDEVMIWNEVRTQTEIQQDMLVPEPASVVLLLVGAAGLMTKRLGRNRKR